MSSNNFKDELSLLEREPVLVRGAIVAIIGVLGAVGLQIDDKTTSAITALILALLALAGAAAARSQVTPVEVANKQIEKAVDSVVANSPDTAKEEDASPVPLPAEDPAPVDPEPVAYDPNETIDAPAPHFADPGEVDVASDADKAVGVVDSSEQDKEDSLTAALRALEKASNAKAGALAATSDALQEVQSESERAAAAYAAKIAEAQQKLAEAQAS